jgi:hypothetical protein
LLEISAGPDALLSRGGEGGGSGGGGSGDGSSPLCFAKEGAVFGARAACDALVWDDDFPFRDDAVDAHDTGTGAHDAVANEDAGTGAASTAATADARRSSRRSSPRWRSARRGRGYGPLGTPPFRVEHPDLAPVRVKCFFREDAYWLRDFGTDSTDSTAAGGHTYLKLKSKTMREAIKMHEGAIFVVGGLVVQVVKMQYSKTKVVWDGRKSTVVSDEGDLDQDHQGQHLNANATNSNNTVDALATAQVRKAASAPGSPTISVSKVSAADVSVGLTGDAEGFATPTEQRARTSSILKKSGSPKRPKSERKKVVFAQTAVVDTKLSESDFEKQVVDEIIESEELHVRILQGPGDLKGRMFELMGDGAITFGTREGSTVKLPERAADSEAGDGHVYHSREASIRMWGSEYYLFTGRNRDALVRVGYDAPFAIRPGDCFVLRGGGGGEKAPLLEFMATLAFHLAPSDCIACQLHRKRLTHPISFEMVGKEVSLGTKDELATVAIKDIKMASLHATMRQWNDTYYLDPESRIKGVYHLIGRAPCYSRGPLMLDANDIFRIGRTEILVESITHADQDPEAFSIREDGFKGVKRRKSRMFPVSITPDDDNDDAAQKKGSPGGYASSTASSDSEFDGPKQRADRAWSTRLSFVAKGGSDGLLAGGFTKVATGSGGSGDGKAGSPSRSASEGSGVEELRHQREQSSSRLKEDWFGYAGRSDRHLFSIEADQLNRRCGGAFALSGGDNGGGVSEAFRSVTGAKAAALVGRAKAAAKAREKFPTITLRVTMGPIRERLFVVNQGIATIGRHPQNTIVIPDRSVSSVHACVCFRAGHFYLTDMNSETGTYSRIFLDDGVALERGDVYLMGQTEMSIYTKEGSMGRRAGCCSVS